MKSFGMLKLPMIWSGHALLPLLQSPEITNDYFAESGVQNVYKGAPAKQTMPTTKQKSVPVQARRRIHR